MSSSNGLAGQSLATEETRTWMYDNCDDQDILGEVERCITRARSTAPQYSEQYSEYGHTVDSDGSDSDECTADHELAVRMTGPYVDSLPPSVRVYLISYLRAYRSLC